MTLKTYLLNRISGKKCRLNGIRPSNRLPSKQRLRQAFRNHMTYSPDQLPPKVDLRPDMTPVEDQSQIGSCSANCLAGAYEYITKKSNGENIDVSRLFIYYNGRAKENPSSITDSGCTMTDGIEALEEFGVCLESIWPYDISQVNTRPSKEAYQDAKSHTITEALQVNIDLNEMKSCLAHGFPFAFGLKLFASFDKAATTGIVPMPGSTDGSRQSDGSHALLAVGYSDQSESFIVRNSWGADWGDQGYCYIPYDYLANNNYCFDVWTIRKLATNDFSQDNWDNDDSVDYRQGNNNDDDDDDGNHVIQDFDEDADDNSGDYGASGSRNDSWNNRRRNDRDDDNYGDGRRGGNDFGNRYDDDSDNNYSRDNNDYYDDQQQQYDGDGFGGGYRNFNQNFDDNQFN